MADAYPNIESLLSRLPPESLAHKLCSCFKDDLSAGKDIETMLQKVLDARREEIEAELAREEGT